MAFNFRLQRVLEYRETQEEEAKQHFLDRRAARLEVEAELIAIGGRRNEMLAETITTLLSHVELEARLVALDDEERLASSSLAVLTDEEEAAEGFWKERRRELQAMQKLRERAFKVWLSEENRREQIALDEWTTYRRVSA